MHVPGDWFQFAPPLVGFLAARVLTFPREQRRAELARLRICAGVTRIHRAGATRTYAIVVDPDRALGQATVYHDGIMESQVTTHDAELLLDMRRQFDQDVADLEQDGWARA